MFTHDHSNYYNNRDLLRHQKYDGFTWLQLKGNAPQLTWITTQQNRENQQTRQILLKYTEINN